MATTGVVSETVTSPGNKGEAHAKYRFIISSTRCCLHVQALPQPWIIYELSMHWLLCIYPSLPQFNFHPTKNSGLPRDIERETSRFICNGIRLHIFEVYINNGFSQGCNDYSCSAYFSMPPNEKRAFLSARNILYSNVNETALIPCYKISDILINN